MNAVGLKINDNSNVFFTNFLTFINGEYTSGDYLSVFSTSYNDSPYIINVFMSATPTDKLYIVNIFGTIYLNAYLPKFIISPYNNL